MAERTSKDKAAGSVAGATTPEGVYVGPAPGEVTEPTPWHSEASRDAAIAAASGHTAGQLQPVFVGTPEQATETREREQ